MSKDGILANLVIRHALDERLHELADAYRSNGMALVASVLEQEVETAGIAYEGSLVCPEGLAVGALRYISEELGLIAQQFEERGEARYYAPCLQGPK